MFCAYNRPRYQVSVYRTVGPLVRFSYSNFGLKTKTLCNVVLEELHYESFIEVET